MTQPQLAQSSPELSASFVTRMMEGLRAVLLDPNETMKVFFKAVPELALAAQAKDQICVVPAS